MVRPNQTDTWKKSRHKWVVARAYQSVCENAHTNVSALQGNFPTTHLRRHTNTTALGPPEKTVRLLYHAGLCCKRSIAIPSALRARESWSTANPRRIKKTLFSRRNSIETVMISVPLDVLKQYFWIFVIMGLLQVH